MHVLSLPPLSLLFSCAVLSTPLVYLDAIPAELNITTPSLGKLPCPQIYPYNMWVNATNTQSGNITLANDTTLATSSEKLTVPTANLVDPITSTSKRTGLEVQQCRELAHTVLHAAFVVNYNLPRTEVLQPGRRRIYAFSFMCNPGYVFVEVFARSVGGPDVRIRHVDFGNEAFGSVTFELQQPSEVRIRLDWGMYFIHTCEFSLFRIDPI